MASVAPLRMPYDGRDVPHAVIEVNQRCNISCTACYKDKSTYTKPLGQILEEIDLVARERRVGVLSLAGGEPTLHPELCTVITEIARRGIQVQLLTNGLDLSEERLWSYKDCGLARVYLHVDSLQKRRDAPGVTRECELDALRERLAERVVRSGLACALTVTLYRTRNLAELPSVVELVLHSRWFDRLLVTCCTDFAAIEAALARNGGLPIVPSANARGLGDEVVSNAEVELILARLGMTPFAFVASDRRAEERRWLFYYAFAARSPEGGARALHLGPSFGRVARLANTLTKLGRGTYPFGETRGRLANLATCVAHAVASADPRVLTETLGFLACLRTRGATLTQKSFIFQQGPSVTAEGALEVCKACPDATIRNGRLMPVCLADLLSPQA